MIEDKDASFTDLALRISRTDESASDAILKLTPLFEAWDKVEVREFYNLCLGRVEIIKKMQQILIHYTSPCGEADEFFKKYIRILDPRVRTFEEESGLAESLRKEFIEEDSISPQNRRMDFYCTNFDGSIYVYELKRPNRIVNPDELLKLAYYKEFTKRYMADARKIYKNIYCYLLCNGVSGSQLGTDILIETFKTKDIYVRKYSEILELAYNYHKSFIDNYGN